MIPTKFLHCQVRYIIYCNIILLEAADIVKDTINLVMSCKHCINNSMFIISAKSRGWLLIPSHKVYMLFIYPYYTK